MTSSLARRLGFVSLLIYGIGDVLGAGIYALVGKVAGLAGSGAWISFALAAMAAGVTGLSYAELSSRFPVAAGAAAYVQRAFKGRLLATLAGIFVLGTGLSSAATISVAFSDYLQELVNVPSLLAPVFLIAGLSFLSFWGILESSRVNILLTAVEFSGLILVIIAGGVLVDSEALSLFWVKTSSELDPSPVLAGVTVAFFAYIGFEDLCNLAEEAKNPGKDIPRAILAAIAVSTVLYMLVTLALQVNLPQEAITGSKTPLLLVLEKAGFDWVVRYFSLIAMLAIANTGLANLIMASRLLYGMSNEGLLPKIAAQVHGKRRTPWVGVVVTGLATLALVLTGGLKILAQTTSLLVLAVFVLVHLSLIRVKLKKERHAGFQVPVFFPFLGMALCLVLVAQFPAEAFLRSGFLLMIGIFFWAIQKFWPRKAA